MSSSTRALRVARARVERDLRSLAARLARLVANPGLVGIAREVLDDSVQFERFAFQSMPVVIAEDVVRVR